MLCGSAAQVYEDEPVLNGKTICIFGGLGQQGGSVVTALKWKYPKASLRIVTRNPDSDKAKAASAAANITCVKGDLFDQASVEAALKGCYGAFLVTNYWAPGMTAEKEIQQMQIFYDAAKKQRVKHVIVSTLLDTRLYKDWQREENDILSENMLVPHYDGKGEGAERIFNQQDDVAVDFILAAFYMDNLTGMMRPQGGKFVFPCGDNELAMTACVDIGKGAAALFARGPPRKNRDGKWPSLNVASDKMPLKEYAKIWAKVVGEASAEYIDIGHKEYIEMMINYGTPEEMAKDIGNMFGFHSRSKYYKDGMDLAQFRTLVPDATGFESFLISERLNLVAKN